MNRKFTYREFTLIVGIVVALFTAFMLWFMPDSLNGESFVTKLPEIPGAELTHEFFRKASAFALFAR